MIAGEITGVINVDLEAANMLDDRPVGVARNAGAIAADDDAGCCIMWRTGEEGWLLAAGEGPAMVVGRLALAK